MQLHERTIGNATVLDVTGQITMGRNSKEFGDKIASLVARPHTRLVINLGGVSYVDSAGLGELVAARSAVSTSGGMVRLVNLTRKLNQLLIITKLSTVFDISLTEDDALAAFE
jgi:anti-sigma B factor antagonist